MIKAWWFKSEGENFGDAICPFILNKMTNQEIIHSNEAGSLASIGSILFYGFSSPKIIWGSGAISSYHNCSMAKSHDVRAVRGPKSRERLRKLGVNCPEIYGDPSILLPYLVDEKEIEKEYEISFLPHWVDLKKVRENKKISQNFNIIDIRSGVHNVLSEIRKSKIIISSSLHGIIVPESFGIPSYYTRLSSRVTGGTFKFEDYYNSTGRELKCYEDLGAKNLDIDKILQKCEQPEPTFEIKKLLEAFPYEITNDRLKKEFLK